MSPGSTNNRPATRTGSRTLAKIAAIVAILVVVALGVFAIALPKFIVCPAAAQGADPHRWPFGRPCTGDNAHHSGNGDADSFACRAHHDGPSAKARSSDGRGPCDDTADDGAPDGAPDDGPATSTSGRDARDSTTGDAAAQHCRPGDSPERRWRPRRGQQRRTERW